MRSRERPSTETFGEAWERLFDPPAAHRGLWSPDGAPENSLAAFQAACAHGYAIELDVQRPPTARRLSSMTTGWSG